MAKEKEHLVLNESYIGFELDIGIEDEHGFQGRVLAKIVPDRFLKGQDERIFKKWVVEVEKMTKRFRTEWT